MFWSKLKSLIMLSCSNDDPTMKSYIMCAACELTIKIRKTIIQIRQPIPLNHQMVHMNGNKYVELTPTPKQDITFNFNCVDDSGYGNQGYYGIIVLKWLKNRAIKV
eukprot:64336_1